MAKMAKHEKGVRINLIISKQLKENAEKQAKIIGISLSEYIRSLIVQDIKKEGK